MPVAFDCDCGIRWFSPPEIACPRCGPEVACKPDPIVWSVGQVPETSVFLSAQMRDGERFVELVRAGIELFVDVAGAAPYVWRPDEGEVRLLGVRYLRIDGVEDINTDLPDFAFDAVAEALEAARQGVQALFFCAAGLKRSPHLLYGVLRSWGYDAKPAWDAVISARPFVDPWDPYLASAERWLAAKNGQRA
jgi:hypothetical protein